MDEPREKISDKIEIQLLTNVIEDEGKRVL